MHYLFLFVLLETCLKIKLLIFLIKRIILIILISFIVLPLLGTVQKKRGYLTAPPAFHLSDDEK